MKDLTPKQLIESATNLHELQRVASKAMRASNPVNGERDDTLAILIGIAYNFGRANAQTS